MNKKARHIGKRKAGNLARKLLRKLHTSEYANSCFTKKKNFFISKKIQLIQKSYNQQCHPSVQVAPSKREERRKKKFFEYKKEKEKEKEKEEEKGKEEKKKEEKMERAVLNFFF